MLAVSTGRNHLQHNPGKKREKKITKAPLIEMHWHKGKGEKTFETGESFACPEIFSHLI